MAARRLSWAKAHAVLLALRGGSTYREAAQAHSVSLKTVVRVVGEHGVTFETRMGDGAEPDEGMWGKLKSAGKRALTGESLFMTHFTNNGDGAQQAAFAAPYPGKIIAINLGQMGGRLICQKDAFLCAAMGTKVGIAFNKKLGAGFFGGEGFILQDLQGDGNVFVHAGGTIIEKHLSGEKLRVDTGCLVAFEPTIEYSIERAGNLKSMMFGGRGPVPGDSHRCGASLAPIPTVFEAGGPDRPLRSRFEPRRRVGHRWDLEHLRALIV